MAAYAIQFRRGTTTEHNSFTGLAGEVTVDTDKNTVVVHNGSTAGGYALALEGAAVSTTTGAFSSNVTIGGTLAVTGGNLTMTGHILPSADITYDLGSATKQWKDIYVGPGSLYVNGRKVIEDDSGSINITTDNNEDLMMSTTGTGTIKLRSANGINLTGELGASSGDIQIGDHIDMNSSIIKELGAPTTGTDAANKTYVDATAASAVTGGANAGSLTTLTTSGNATIGGNLTVSGTTTTINTTILDIGDNIIELNSDATGSPTENAGIDVQRGDAVSKQLLWDESNDKWTVAAETFVAGTFEGDLTGDVTGDTAGVHTGAVLGNVTGNTAGVHTGAVTGNVTGNTAGVHTGAVTGDVTGNTSGSAGTVTSIAAHIKDEDNMASDSATHVPSQQSVKKYVDDSILTKDNTDEITEGSTNLYHTTARARAAISASGSLSYNSTSGVMSFTMNDETVQDIVGAMITSNTETGVAVTYDDADGTLDFVVASQTDENFTTADHAKLDGIEASATADQTAAEIRVLVEAASDSNVFNDADHSKLNAIEATADVTDGTNVAAAGAVMESDATTAAMSMVVDEDNMASDSATKLATQQSIKAYVDAVSTAFAAADSADAVAWAAADTAINTAWAAADAAQTTSINTAWAAADTAQTTALQSYADTAEADAKTYADAAVAAIVDGAPGTLNTLNELAAAIADDASYSTTLTTLVGTKLALAGGAMTGAITTNSTFDGRDVATDGTKLDGIEASADVTDTANVTSAGALMDSELTGIAHVKSLNQALTSTSSPSFTAVTATDFNGTATYAKYADLAERYAADATYEEGTVMTFGGEAEVTSAQGYGSTAIAGVVSTKPGFAMNEEAGNSETHPYIALQGRVPCKVTGTVSKGDILVASEVSGTATKWLESSVDPRMTAYVGIAIEDKATDGEGYVEVKVGK